VSDTTDVIVVGVGTCGEDAALRLMAAGLHVTGIEARLLGGECAYWACLPTKSMVRSANLLREARRADGLIGRVNVEPDWSLVADRVRAEITGNWDDAPAVARFEGHGGRFVRGRGVLTGPSTVVVDGIEFEARRGIIIATGSTPVIPPIPGLTGADGARPPPRVPHPPQGATAGASVDTTSSDRRTPTVKRYPIIQNSPMVAGIVTPSTNHAGASAMP
jgi:pyruvate/2-oxoglutarate dehydrogenase complex dihydrolipoamide dehydrogenase (E3) component